MHIRLSRFQDEIKDRVNVQIEQMIGREWKECITASDDQVCGRNEMFALLGELKQHPHLRVIMSRGATGMQITQSTQPASDQHGETFTRVGVAKWTAPHREVPRCGVFESPVSPPPCPMVDWASVG